MAVNRFRGDVRIVINGENMVARLTLGALVELEETLDATSLVGLVERFESNAYSSRDVVALLGAGLRGGGNDVCDAELMRADVEGGPVAASQAAAQLLARAFVVAE